MSPARVPPSTSRSRLRPAVLLLAMLSALLLGSFWAGQVAAHTAAASDRAATVAAPVDRDGPCLPQDTCPEQAARALGSGMTGTDLIDDGGHPSSGPDRFAVRAVAMPPERLPALGTGRLLAVLCVWRT